MFSTGKLCSKYDYSHATGESVQQVTDEDIKSSNCLILNFDLKLKLNGKIIYPIKSVKYIGIKTSLGLIILMILLLRLTGLMLC